MPFIVEALAKSRDGSRAVKLSILVEEEPGAMQKSELRARVVAQYRVQYQEWSDGDATVTVKPHGR